MKTASRFLRAMVCAYLILTPLIVGTIGSSEAAAAMEGRPNIHMPGELGMGPAPRVRKKSSNPAIVTEDGPLKGIVAPDINEYLGIPYAAPPVGEQRWMPPQPHGRWHGVLKATETGNACPQLDPFGNEFGDEDCLTLNVYTPGLKKNQNKHDGLPVMVWIHGGSLVTGSGAFYDPTQLVERGNVIVVTINYRLGVLGFFAHPALDVEGHLNANYGLMDQQFALQWVQRNIAAFGGDPDRVTIFGQSAGALSVYSNLASPTAADLFQRAIAESGAYTSFQDYLQSIVHLATAEAEGAAFAAAVGCGNQTAQCLRATSAASLVDAEPTIVYPVVDGTVLTQPPGAALASGQFNRVPVISGSNHDEYRLFVAFFYDYAGHPLTDEEYPAAVAAFLQRPDPFVQHVLSLYPLTNYPPPPPPFLAASAPLALGALGTDVIFACTARNADLFLSQYVPTYAYEFNDENAPVFWDGGNSFISPATFPLGAYHASEIPYLLNIFGVPAPFTPEQQQLSDAMIGYWTQFARTGDPNSPGLPTWSPYNAATDQFQSFVPPAPTVEAGFDADHQCSSFWSTF
jgi:para-nitrobenzyl esterase